MSYGLYSVWECWWLAPLALALDLWLGDPRLPWPHPVCLLGKALNRMEGKARAFSALYGARPLASPYWGQRVERLAGLICLFLLVGAVALATALLTSLPVMGPLLALYLAWAGLALGSLLTSGQQTLHQVEYASQAEAREAVAQLVSRETSHMGRQRLRKSLADSLSENFTDAWIAPFFWLLLAGPVGLWCYKAVSTVDSMWGYKSPPWRWLGWAGARADDALAFVPARLAVLALWLTERLFASGLLVRLSTGLQTRLLARSAFVRLTLPVRTWEGSWPGWNEVARQAGGMSSPNAGWSMAACAWLCKARLAGPETYFGEVVDKPWLGPPEQAALPWSRARLLALCGLLRAAGLSGALGLWAAGLALGMVLGLN